jgi:hypothetical protein
MYSPAKSSTSHQATRSFLEEWSERKFPAYLREYGGERSGVPKGDYIPFPSHKVKAAITLLAYGAPRQETLKAIARTAHVSSALLRVWRTEDRFLASYRRAVWECADDYVRLLSKSWNNQYPAPYQEFQLYFGVALQEGILRRLCVDVLRMDSEWAHFGLNPKWLSECDLIGVPPKTPADFFQDDRSIANVNSLLLLAIILVQRRIKDPMMAQWASLELMDKWTRLNVINTDLRPVVEKNENRRGVDLIDFVTGNTPLDDIRKLYHLLRSGKPERRR